MKILLQPGQRLEIAFADENGHETDGNMILNMASEEFTIETEWPDDIGREGELYKVTWADRYTVIEHYPPDGASSQIEISDMAYRKFLDEKLIVWTRDENEVPYLTTNVGCNVSLARLAERAEQEFPIDMSVSCMDEAAVPPG